MKNRRLVIAEDETGMVSVEMSCAAHDTASVTVRMLVWGIDQLTNQLFMQTQAGADFKRRMDEVSGGVDPQHIAEAMAARIGDVVGPGQLQGLIDDMRAKLTDESISAAEREFTAGALEHAEHLQAEIARQQAARNGDEVGGRRETLPPEFKAFLQAQDLEQTKQVGPAAGVWRCPPPCATEHHPTTVKCVRCGYIRTWEGEG